jgi:hypothetical protein
MPQQFRITFRSEIFIEANSKEEAEQKFEQIELFTEEARNNGASFVETNSVDFDGYVTPRKSVMTHDFPV